MQDSNSRERLKLLFWYTLLLLLGFLVYRIFHSFLVPIAWAIVLAIAFYPVHRRIARRLRPGIAAILSMLAVTLILIVPSILVTVAFINEGISAARALQAAQSKTETTL